MVAGEYEVEAVAGLARGKLRNKIGALKEALEGRLQPHQRFMLAAQLGHVDSLDSLIEEVSGEVERRLATLQVELRRLSTIPGVSTRISQAMLSEMGADMERFASAGHLASWVAICPGHDESAGKSRSGRTRKGSPWLRSALVQAAKAAGRTQTYLGAQYRRIAARRGANRAAVAVAHSIIVIAYYMLKRGEDYRDLGCNYFDERQEEQVKKRLTRRLEALGFRVHLEAAV